MNRMLSLMVIAVMLCGLFVGCGKAQDTTTTDTPTTTAPSTVPSTTVPSTTVAPSEPNAELPVSALEMLETICNAWDFEYKNYFMGGGYATEIVEGAPGAVDPTDTETLMNMLYVPEGCVANVQDAASYCHSMNYSVFTSGAFKVADAAVFAADLKAGLDSTQWMCGIPEHLMIYTLGQEHVLFVMGTAENLESFRPALQAAYPDAVAFFDGLMG